MKRVALPLLFVLGLAAAGGVSAGVGSSTTSTGTTTDPQVIAAGVTIGGVDVGGMTPDEADVAVTTSFEAHDGRCQLGPTYIVVNVGTAVIGNDPAAQRVRTRHFYFAAAVGKLPGDRGQSAHRAARADGTYSLRLLTLVDAGKRYVVKRGNVTLSGERRQGRFRGVLRGGPGLAGDGRQIIGTWTC